MRSAAEAAMYKIPDEFQHLPEAARLKIAQTKFAASAEHARHLSFKDEEEIRLAGEQLRRAQNELQQAQKAFDHATGEPKPVGLTPRVVDEIAKHFPPEQLEDVKHLLDDECGRTIPFFREATAEDVEHIRVCVLRLSRGNLSELREWIRLANIDQRDVLLAAGSLMRPK
jgi:hypothetical protein